MNDFNPQCQMVVVKIASRCNINCTYCYMYNLGDETYKQQPKIMAKDTVNLLLKRIKEHCIANDIEHFYISLHGGEPLLAGEELVTYIVTKAKEVLLPEVEPFFVMQTNGMLLTDSWCKIIGELNINIGISIDGNKKAHDQYRIDHKGNGTYDRVIKGLEIASNSEYLPNPPGILSVVNVEVDPIETYEHFKSIGVKSIDLLWPDHTHDHPPLTRMTSKSETPHGDWKIAMFDHWYKQKPDKRIKIRYFEYVIALLIGRDISFDTLGNSTNDVLVIETDGGIEAVDTLKTCGDGFTKEGANLHNCSFDEALQTDLARMYHYSHKKLCKQCLACPINEVCGAGYIPHRYSSKNGFNNPSIYCKDLLKLITHIQNIIFSELPDATLKEFDLELISYENALQSIDTNLSTIADPNYVDELEAFKKLV